MTSPTAPNHADPYRKPEVLWTEDIAAFMGVGVVQALRMMRSGKIPGKRIGKRWTVLRKEFIRTLRP